ncbi:MAG: hypothetical protein HN768_17780 [Rhodospirillaceae bacterium]|nr:hypothetical protein [Rhodospirillaceae bacterium]MBT7614786.1 hypothetical protein [Rhodospirillaceae bacterium]MBT7648885.1 hypothetical protein [Rhodospirillaceae bacterium]
MHDMLSGDQISVWLGVYRHYGIIVDDLTVIHNSKIAGQVVRETVDDFAGGRQVTNHGKAGTLPRDQIARNAIDTIGRPYKLFEFNCEHHVSEVSGRYPCSPQLRIVVFLAAASLLFSHAKA